MEDCCKFSLNAVMMMKKYFSSYISLIFSFMHLLAGEEVLSFISSEVCIVCSGCEYENEHAILYAKEE